MSISMDIEVYREIMKESSEGPDCPPSVSLVGTSIALYTGFTSILAKVLSPS